MEEGGNNQSGGGNNQSGGSNTTISHQHQQILMQQHQQQLFLIQQYQQQHQQHQQQQQQQPPQPPPPTQQQPQQPQPQHMQQQQAISRFPSNIDAHLRSPGLRSLHLNQPHQPQPQQINPHPHPHQQQQLQQQQIRAGTGIRGNQQPPPVEVEMALQDAIKICNPDIKRPFSSLEDAVLRLLPYHVVSDFEAEEDDRILDSDSSGQIPSRLQQWDHNILAKIAEFTTTFEKQVLAFNIMSKKRGVGEFRSEERLMIEQALLQEEKRSLLEARAAIESREKAMRAAQADMFARAPPPPMMRSSGDDEADMAAWGRGEEDEPSEDFLNDENEPDNGAEAGLHEDWPESGELDLNTR